MKSFLSADLFVVLGRLQYMVYMIHILVMLWFFCEGWNEYHINYLSNAFMTMSFIAISFLLAVPATLIMEAPWINLEKVVMAHLR